VGEWAAGREWRRAARRLALGLAGGAAAAAAEPRGAGEPLLLGVVTYNVHGLPGWVACDAPAERAPRIGALLDGFAVALVQEDWSHHEALRLRARHPIALRSADAGLTTLVRSAGARVLESERVPYGSCAGWLGGANDCWAEKGILRARLRLANGARLDLVNTHLEAGRGAADRAVREEQLEVLARHLETRSGAAALVLGGDFNLHWEDPHDRGLVERFAARLRLSDSGARPDPPWGRIDYLFARSGEGARLEVLAAGEVPGFAAEGRPLSDHPALFARLRVAPAGQGP
jgi:hypothetical protein